VRQLTTPHETCLNSYYFGKSSTIVKNLYLCVIGQYLITLWTFLKMTELSKLEMNTLSISVIGVKHSRQKSMRALLGHVSKMK